MKLNMSDSQEENEVKLQIQKLLMKINEDMKTIKDELKSLHSLIEENATLPMTAKMVNEKLMMAAQNAGVDLSSLKVDESSDEESEQNGNEQATDLESITSAAALAAATKDLSERVQQTLESD